MEQTNHTLILDLLDVHNIRVNVEDNRMSFVEAVETEARTQGVQVSGAKEVVLPEKHLYLKDNIMEALHSL
ncbi:hypothetical protein [Paenibacillus sp. MMS20-IR301]|uniref:hypothetical protein n=1 Tax=Paenibacillus sp. MMS20-IR301 TaxID=2895946 RepID=UPI0028E57E41|nr:hypothetical protein [Paenibacillus sp. MMS20-IR301]WNS46283.1 hypothetical protein LOS79_13775 [Paenibacillus sp. MMS20-IR301]